MKFWLFLLIIGAITVLPYLLVRLRGRLEAKQSFNLIFSGFTLAVLAAWIISIYAGFGAPVRINGIGIESPWYKWFVTIAMTSMWFLTAVIAALVMLIQLRPPKKDVPTSTVVPYGTYMPHEQHWFSEPRRNFWKEVKFFAAVHAVVLGSFVALASIWRAIKSKRAVS